MSDPILRLTEVQQQINDAYAELDKLIAERGRLLVELAGAGRSKRGLSLALGLSGGRVQQLVKKASERS